MKRASRLAAALLFAGPLLDAGSAHAWCRTTTDTGSDNVCTTSGAPLFWARRCQTYSLDVAAGGGVDLATVRTAAAASFATWSAVSCGQGPVLSIVESAQTVNCNEAEYSSVDGNSNTIAFANDFPARMLPDAIAVTVVWHNTDTGQIYDADMLFNEAYGPFVQCPASGCVGVIPRFDLQNTMTHEAGHFVGLAHSDVETATMYFSADRNELTKRSLDADDIAGLCAAYDGATVPAECDPTPRHGFDADCTVERAPDDGCGCRVGGAPSRRAPSALGATALLGLTAWWRRRRRGS